MLRIGLTALLLGTPHAASLACETTATHEAWWVDSLQQVLVDDLVPASPMPGELRAARGEYEAIQVAVRSPTACRVAVTAPAFGTGLEIRVRTFGRVPITRGTHHTPKAERVAEPPAK